jgi:hypothetical protein
MDKQRMSNILSSIQMNPRDRKDFIDELSKLGAGGQGGEVSGEHPVRIIELTEEDMMTGKKLDITGKEYLKYHNIIIYKTKHNKNIFNYEYSYSDTDMGADYYYDVYCCKMKSDYSELNLCITVQYTNSENTIYIDQGLPINYKGDINFVLSQNAELNLTIVSECNPNWSYSVILFKDGSTIHGTYHNGTFTAFAEGKLKQYNVDTQTGAITEGIAIDINTLSGLEARIAALENA